MGTKQTKNRQATKGESQIMLRLLISNAEYYKQSKTFKVLWGNNFETRIV